MQTWPFCDYILLFTYCFSQRRCKWTGWIAVKVNMEYMNRFTVECPSLQYENFIRLRDGLQSGAWEFMRNWKTVQIIIENRNWFWSKLNQRRLVRSWGRWDAYFPKTNRKKTEPHQMENPQTRFYFCWKTETEIEQKTQTASLKKRKTEVLGCKHRSKEWPNPRNRKSRCPLLVALSTCIHWENER